MPPLSACAYYYCITACLSAVGCWGECCMPQVLYRIRAMHAYQVCNRWVHGMGNETPCRIAATANESAGCHYVVIVQSGVSSMRQGAPAGHCTMLCAAPAAAWVPCKLACTRRPCCALARPPRGAPAAAWVPCELACTRRPCFQKPRPLRGALVAARVPCELAMHAQALLCGTTVPASCPGSGVGTLRARMHAQALLCGTAVTASCPGSGVSTLRARMHA